MRPFFVLLFTFSFGFPAFSQIEKVADKMLLTKDFIRFEKFADSLNKSKGNIRSHWEYKRELVQGYWEGVFYFEKYVKDKFNPAISSVYGFRVNLIATDSVIIYFDLGEKKNQKVDKEWVPYYESMDHFKNDSLFSVLNNSFIKTFRADLNFSELFNLSIVYSDGGCGYVGTLSKEKMQLDTLVMKKDLVSLRKWLGSSNTETQLYAVDGFHRLKKEGVLLTPMDLEMINAVLQKKGTVQTCSGCMYGLDEINRLAKDFKF
jgi:hypothetical protein